VGAGLPAIAECRCRFILTDRTACIAGKPAPTTRQTDLQPSEQLQLLDCPLLKSMQAHAKPQQSHGLGPAIANAWLSNCLVTLKVPPCTRLLQRGLGKVMEFHFDEGLAGPITAVDTLQCARFRVSISSGSFSRQLGRSGRSTS
jgi:hypothetical protein